MLIDREITIKIAPREDGGIRVWSDEVPGFILLHSNQELVLADIGMTLLSILRHRSEQSGQLVGKYRADYSPVTPEELAATDPELDEFYRNSHPTASQVRE